MSPEQTELVLIKPEILLHNYSVHFWNPSMNSHLLFLFNWLIHFSLFMSICIHFIYIFINISISKKSVSITMIYSIMKHIRTI